MDQPSSEVHQVTVNGKTRDTGAGTLAALLEELTLDASTVVAEVNAVIVPREDFASTRISAGDVVELVRFVGGG